MSYLADDESQLELIGALDEPDLSYGFNTMEVVRHIPSGRVFYGVSSGCSCPTPFEEYHFSGPEDTDLTPITIGDSFESFQREVDAFPDEMQAKQELLAAVKKALSA